MQNNNLELTQQELNVLEAWRVQLQGTTDNIAADKKEGITNALFIIAAHLEHSGADDIPSIIGGLDVNETLWQLKQMWDFFNWIEVLGREEKTLTK